MKREKLIEFYRSTLDLGWDKCWIEKENDRYVFCGQNISFHPWKERSYPVHREVISQEEVQEIFRKIQEKEEKERKAKEEERKAKEKEKNGWKKSGRS